MHLKKDGLTCLNIRFAVVNQNVLITFDYFIHIILRDQVRLCDELMCFFNEMQPGSYAGSFAVTL